MYVCICSMIVPIAQVILYIGESLMSQRPPLCWLVHVYTVMEVLMQK